MNALSELAIALITATPVDHPAAAFGRVDGIEAWWVSQVARRALSSTIARAAVGGAMAERLSWAFASGYHAALTALSPDLTYARVALAATEKGGAHPRAIATTLTPNPGGGFTLDGQKRWTTMGMHADLLLVVARRPDLEGASGRPKLVVARVGAAAPGVSRTRMPAPPFCPEIEHAEVGFDAVAIEQGDLLAGDGYDDVLKPFRTLEDAHVAAAALGHAVGLTRRNGLDRSIAERAFACIVTLQAIADAPPLDASTHVALAGALASAAPLLAEVATALRAKGRGDLDDVAARLERDAPLLAVASGVRAQRTQKAWEHFEQAGALLGL